MRFSGLRCAALLAAAGLAGAGQAPAREVALAQALDTLVAAYPDHLSHVDGNDLVWKDGTRMLIDDGVHKDHEAKLSSADIEDMLSQPYPVGPCSYSAPARNADPGRIRNEAFFRKMYGETRAAARANLVPVQWVNRQVPVTRVNGVGERIAAVARELAALPPSLAKYFTSIGGTFSWRPIAGTSRLSVHSFGAALDINTRYTNYWRWSGGKPGNVPAYQNQVPREIVEIFERHGFIWGGKWYHYDTMHFEYRPELLATASRQDAGSGC